MLCALIMAGGKGERFWPISTEEKPKQFLNLIGEKSMIQHTVKRLEKLVPIERVFIVTAEKYKRLIKEQLPKLPEENVIVEPEAKNTAPCIALSAFYIREKYEDANIVVLPSDHLILDESNFINIIKSSNEFINKNKDAILTIGIKPTRPDTGYGYIKIGEPIDIIEGNKFRLVYSFKEKPCLEQAEIYVKDKIYLWNSGMFIWKASTIIENTKKFLPKTYDILSKISMSDKKYLSENYKNIEPVSVDYGIMEKTTKIYVVQGSFGWDDLGSWNSLIRYKDTDNNNNVIEGSVALLESKDNIIQTKKPTYIMGVENLVIIETVNEIMIVNRADLEKIKELKNYGE